MQKDSVIECSELSDDEKIHFGQVIGKLLEAGIELYYADLSASTKTFYEKDEAFTVKSFTSSTNPIAAAFSAEGVKRAIKQAQLGEIKYQEFVRQAKEAGVISYIVFISGRKVVYFGRKGEQHVEPFPNL